MKKTQHTFENTFEVLSKDADFSSRVRIGSLMNYFIQIAWQHAEYLGWGYTHLMSDGLGWVLSRFKIKIHAIPSWPGAISLVTWPKGKDRLFYVRDAEMWNEQKEKVASITSYWLIIDKNSKRPQVHNRDAELIHLNQNRHALNETLKTLQFGTATSYIKEYQVNYCDIDMNQHLTAARYVELLFDTYTLDFIEKKQVKELTVNYLKEIPFGAQIEVQRTEHGNLHNFQIVDKADQSVCFLAEIIYS